MAERSHARKGDPGPKPVAFIDDWSVGDWYGHYVLFGVCKEHPNRRELEGIRIRSSPIVEERETEIETVNTVYKLGTKSEERPYGGSEID